MLIYNVKYRDAKTGKPLKEDDKGLAFMKRAPKGLIADCECRNGSRDESYTVDEHGRITAYGH